MKQKYFKTENIFFLSGHGAENLRNPQRYKLHTNQYAAIALNPGEQGLIKSDLYKVIDDKDFELNGPSSIPSGRSAIYEGSVRVSMKSAEVLSIAPSCSNCQ